MRIHFPFVIILCNVRRLANEDQVEMHHEQSYLQYTLSAMTRN